MIRKQINTKRRKLTMENGKEKCSTCRHWDRYYTKGVKRYNKTGCGWCCKKQENVTAHESCEEYVKTYHYRTSKYAIKRCLNDILTEITSIRTVIEDAEDEEV